MSLNPFERIGRIISAPMRDTDAPVPPPVEPLQSLPVLIGWMLGPPAPMPRKRAIVKGEVQVIASPPGSPSTGKPT